ncbi:hypothetical protein RF11_05415 [Thelohanellus kitauei]|uniref:Uncharacterized protein n=1 Tax=Thelohanellus kitauei TaxID=669202 RepID=A0A0C2IZS8_THEKT|nr:hypothetical protein RF11_05415 [Thelohanellus kitauei]
MALLYVFLSVVYVLKAQASTPAKLAAPATAAPAKPGTPAKAPEGGKPPSKEASAVEQTYPFKDGKGGFYGKMMPSTAADTTTAESALKANPKYTPLLPCSSTQKADGVEGPDKIQVVELKCKDGKMYYPKIAITPDPKSKYKKGQLIEMLEQAPNLIPVLQKHA